MDFDWNAILLYPCLVFTALNVSRFHGLGIDDKFRAYRTFHRFVQAKFAYGGQILGSSRFLLLPQLPEKMKLRK